MTPQNVQDVDFNHVHRKMLFFGQHLIRSQFRVDCFRKYTQRVLFIAAAAISSSTLLTRNGLGRVSEGGDG